MTHLRGAVDFDPSHRLYDSMRYLVTMTACVSIAAQSIQNKPIPQTNTFFSKQFGVTVELPARGTVESALLDSRPQKIAIYIADNLGPPPSAVPRMVRQGSAKTLFPILVMMISAVLVNFYETYRPWIQDPKNCGMDVTQWPEAINFGRVIRNFISHHGKVHFEKVTSPAVSWHHIAYSPTDKGRVVIGTEVSYADLLILMIEMSADLDRLQAPIL